MPSEPTVPAERERPEPTRKRRAQGLEHSGASLGSSYHLNPTTESRGNESPEDDAPRPQRASYLERKTAGPIKEGLLPPLKSPETSAFASLLYPLRGADCIGILAAMSVVLWIFMVLVPEYCLTAMGDAKKMNASLIGALFAILAAIPGVILGPIALAFWLQYLGRVLVSSAMGETLPPRAPNRNAQGLLQGLAPWLVWLVMGFGVGILPALWIGPRPGWSPSERAIDIVVLFLFATAYMAPALMLSFLHDEPLAATPIGVVVAWFKLGVQIPRICLIVAGLIATAAVPTAITASLREHHIWIYLLLALFCLLVVLWALVALMRVLGLCYHHRASKLNWHSADPRWGESWRL